MMTETVVRDLNNAGPGLYASCREAIGKGPGAGEAWSTLGMLPKGTPFRFGTEDNGAPGRYPYTAAARGWMRDAEGRSFRSGTRTLVIVARP